MDGWVGWLSGCLAGGLVVCLVVCLVFGGLVGSLFGCVLAPAAVKSNRKKCGHRLVTLVGPSIPSVDQLLCWCDARAHLLIDRYISYQLIVCHLYSFMFRGRCVTD